MQLNHTQVTYIQKSFLKLWPDNVKNLGQFIGVCWIWLGRDIDIKCEIIWEY